MQKNLPLVSIGLPIFNRPEGLIRSLECLVNQTYQNIEIIIADNCSTNVEVEKIAREYLAKDSRISYYRHDSNKGWGYNTNFVIEKAKAEYFMRATDDDWWDEMFVEKIMGLMLKNPESALGFCNFIAIDMNGNRGVHYPDFLPLIQEFEGSNKIKGIKNYIKQFEGLGKSNLYFSIYKTELLRSEFVYNTLKEERLAGDLQVNLFCLLRGDFVVHTDLLFKVTFGNEKYYEQNKIENKVLDLFLLTVDYKKIKSLHKNWSSYLYTLYSVVQKSTISKIGKIQIFATITKKIVLFYFDVVCVSFRLRGYDIFSKIKRKYYLE